MIGMNDPFGIKHKEVIQRLDAIGKVLLEILEELKD
jgi:hypothetical protein